MEVLVQEAVISPLSSWESFYVITGSSGAALTGLQFVVIALTTELRARRTLDQINAFATPTIVHFCASLFIAATLSAPWQELWSAAIPIGLAGAAGIVYTALVMRRVRRQSEYVPVFEDWLFHTGLPLLSYAMVLSSGLTLVSHTVDALFGVAVASLLLLFIGIHNAWDTVTYIATDGSRKPPSQETADPEAPADAAR
jgi:hypothetical protein